MSILYSMFDAFPSAKIESRMGGEIDGIGGGGGGYGYIVKRTLLISLSLGNRWGSVDRCGLIS